MNYYYNFFTKKQNELSLLKEREFQKNLKGYQSETNLNERDRMNQKEKRSDKRFCENC